MYKGDFLKGAIIPFEFSLADATGAAVDASDAFETADLVLYKGSGTTERASAAGFAISSAFDSKTGLVSGYVSTGGNTDAGFFAIGEEYKLGLVPDTETVDSVPVSAWVLRFSLQRVTSLKPVAGLAQGGTTGYIDLPTTASSVDDNYRGACVRVVHAATGIVEFLRQGTTAYVGATRRFTFDAASQEACAAGDEVELFLMPVAAVSNLPIVDAKYINGTAQTAGDVTALVNAIGVIVSNITAKTTNLPSDPADASDVATLIGAVETKIDGIKGITDFLTLAAIGQQTLKALSLTLGNKLFIDGTDIVLTDTDGTTEIGRTPFIRLGIPANPFESVGGS